MEISKFYWGWVRPGFYRRHIELFSLIVLPIVIGSITWIVTYLTGGLHLSAVVTMWVLGLYYGIIVLYYLFLLYLVILTFWSIDHN